MYTPLPAPFKADFESKLRLPQHTKFKHKPQPLLLCLGVRNRFQLFFSPLVLQTPLEISWGRNFSIFWSRGFGHLRSYGNLLAWVLPFCSTLFLLFPSDHHESMLSGLGKLFPSVCAFCLINKLFSQNFQFFMNFGNFALFFILHVCLQHRLVLRYLAFSVKILSCW